MDDKAAMDVARVKNFMRLKHSNGRGKPASLAAAKEESLALWLYLEDNPEYLDKFSIPEERFERVADYKFACPMCAVFYARKCKGCPLRFEKSPENNRVMTCRSGKHPYMRHAHANNVVARKAFAHEIVKAIKAWSPEEA